MEENNIAELKTIPSYRLNIESIQTLDDVKTIFGLMNLISTYGDDHPDKETLEKYFNIPL
jgi:hypothetical protein